MTEAARLRAEAKVALCVFVDDMRQMFAQIRREQESIQFPRSSPLYVGSFSLLLA